MTLDELQSCINTQFSPWVSDLALQAHRVTPSAFTLTLPNPPLTTSSAKQCVHAYTVAAETAMTLVVARTPEEIASMHCIAMNINFIKRMNTGNVKVVATLLRRGRSIAFSEASLYDENDELIAQAHSTYALHS